MTMFRAAELEASASPMRRGPLLTVVAPTFNECENVGPLIEKIDAALAGVEWEVVFVDDDSTDGTRDAVLALARRDSRIRLIHRIGRRGLASAVIEGMLSSSAPYMAVIDADMQHDERILPDMLDRLVAGDADLVVGSRYIEGGGVSDWASDRQKVSRFATRLAKLVLRADLSDPMSGFFMITRAAFYGAVRRTSNSGYKVLLDLFASSERPLKVVELAYEFRSRIHGESKLDSLVALEYLELLLDKSVGRYLPTRFIMFGAVGGLGVLVHLATLTPLFTVAHLSFTLAQSMATVVAMTFNFFLNNWLTYRDKRLKGFWPLLGGLVSFYAVCSVGAAANVGVSSFLFAQHSTWWLAAIAGILMGVVWNYAASTIFTWRSKR